MTIVGAANCTAEEHESCVILTGSEYLSGMPWERRSVKGHEYESVVGACDEQCGIIQAQPRSLTPVGDVDKGNPLDQMPAGRHEPMGGVLVSQQPTRCRFLHHATG
jgi:hypothetical protein